MFIPAVTTFGCLFRGVWVLCVKCQSTLQLILVSFLVWCLSIVIDGCASSDWSPGLMLIRVCCFFMSGSHLGPLDEVVSYQFVMLCVCVAHDVCIMLGLSSVFLVFFVM